MSTLLLKNAETVLAMDSARREIRDGALFIRDNIIEHVGVTNELPTTADRVIDARGMVVLPGLVNTHHHLYQTLTRAIPAAQDADLFHWLKTLYPIWAELTPDAIYTSALVGLAELVLSGCTTAADHLYLFPNGSKLDDEIRAAREIGIRFHPTRGSMSLGESKGGLPPDRVCESEEAILRDSRRVIETFHDTKPYSMCRVSLAPCSPFSVTPELMRESAHLARSYKVQLHTHLAETRDEEDFCLQKFGYRPVDYAEHLEWLGSDVWFAHSVWVNDEEIKRYGKTGTGIAHCPSSNMRLASGIAPIVKMLNAGVKVGLGVDGSASNDSSHMLAETRQAMLLQRVGMAIARYHLFTASYILSSDNGDSAQPKALTARQSLELGTLGGARVLGRDDIGSLEKGKAADFIAINVNQLDFAGALHDPVSAIVFCSPPRVDLSVINGKIVVEDGRLKMLELPPVIERHNRIAREMLQRATSR